MRPVRAIIALVLLLVGLVWVGQGIGFIGGSARSDQTIWAVIGAALIVIAIAVGWSARRRGDRPTLGA